jgi:hypothetical protein
MHESIDFHSSGQIGKTAMKPKDQKTENRKQKIVDTKHHQDSQR